MNLSRAPLLLAALFAFAQVGCAATQTKPDAPVAQKKVRKKKKRPKVGAPAPVGGDEADDGSDGDDDGEMALTDGAVQEGVASYYHDSLAGRRTASGERYDPRDATCAHRTLPFGTVVRVEDVETGKSAVCVVNDRGPFIKGRIVDVSKSVAKDIGFQERGITRVRVHVVERQRREI